MNKAALHLKLGPMFSGKTSILLRSLSDASKIGIKCLYINHSFDTREENKFFSSHNPLIQNVEEVKFKVVSVCSLDDNRLPPLVKEAQLIAIDEAQFFESLRPVLTWVNQQNKHVIIAALNADFLRRPFGTQVSSLVAQADSVVILSAYCSHCSEKGKIKDAVHTHRIETKNTKKIVVGDINTYQPLCRKCYNLKHKQQNRPKKKKPDSIVKNAS